MSQDVSRSFLPVAAAIAVAPSLCPVAHATHRFGSGHVHISECQGRACAVDLVGIVMVNWQGLCAGRGVLGSDTTRTAREGAVRF